MNIFDAQVISQEQLTEDIFSMWIHALGLTKDARPGQFVSLYTNHPSKLLPRPISICEIDKENDSSIFSISIPTEKCLKIEADNFSISDLPQQ